MRESEVREVHIRLQRARLTEEELYNLRSHLFDHKGSCPLYLHIAGKNGEQDTVIQASSQITLTASGEVLEQLRGYPTIEDIWTA
jgi:hypothetical protein